MSKVIGAIEIVVGIALVAFVPGAQAIGINLIIAGVMTEATALLTPSAKQQQRQAAVTTLQLGEVARQAVFGEALTGGSLVDAFNYGGQYGTDWEVLVVSLADHECTALEGFYVNDTFVSFAADGPVSGYNGQLEVYWRSGAAGETLPSVLTTNGPGWTASDVGKGVCKVVAAYKADASDAKNPVWPGGRPSFKWLLKGAKCYDPRKDSTVSGGSGSHRRETPSTWEWTENPIVCRYSWVRGIYALDQVDDPTMLLVGRGLSAVEAPPENVFAPANLCDELVTVSEGVTEPRYRVGGVVSADQTFIDVEEMFAAACAGVIHQPQGAVEIEPGQAKSPVATITDADLIVGSGVNVSNFLSRADNAWVNTVVPRYNEPTQEWQDHGAPIRRVDADVAADGGSREQTLTLSLVHWASQAGRCGEIARRLGRLWKRATVTLGPRFCELEEGDWIEWQSDRYLDGATVTFRIEAYSLDERWQNTLTLREIAASVYADDVPTLTDGAVAVAPSAPALHAAPGSGAWTLAAEQLGDTTQIPALVVTGAVDNPYAQSVIFEYRIDDSTDPALATDWVSAGAADPTVTRREITSVASATPYYAAISYIVSGTPGDRRILGPVTTGAVSGVSSGGTSGGGGTTELILDGGDALGDLR